MKTKKTSTTTQPATAKATTNMSVYIYSLIEPIVADNIINNKQTSWSNSNNNCAQSAHHSKYHLCGNNGNVSSSSHSQHTSLLQAQAQAQAQPVPAPVN